ncbi:hypothetical protein [Pseudidiomarina sp. CB1]|uniref:hypothetical protein n=1 Tax=Pseudidiomarina sp. CB1 TaxID=2972484 RepID=UPI002161FF9E|nr:hypothetical protein [Pseudidiomarina sp. CB1]
MSSSQQRLLVIAGLLAAIQFLVLPFIEFQNQQHDELALLQQRLTRSEQLLENSDALNKAWETVTANEAALLEAIPAASDKTMHRIAVQGEIQNIARANEITVDEFNWLTDARFVSDTVEVQRVKIRLQGSASQVAKTQVELTQKLPSIRFVDVNLTPYNTRSRGSAAAKEPQVRIELLLEVATRTPAAVAGDVEGADA